MELMVIKSCASIGTFLRGLFQMRALLVFCTALTAGCGTGVMGKGERIPVSLTPVLEDQVRNGLAKRLRDPDSLRLSSVAAGLTPDGNTIVCGLYNARNGFGGYAGRAPFAVLFRGSEVGIVLHDPDSGLIIHGICNSNGLSIRD